ncbi:MAG TPA: hypothetical protein VM733_01565, partial [Thermoanaerobaculia bacterium]|nr:hypothetical protein [Thermoanaerobaculia bacterium]
MRAFGLLFVAFLATSASALVDDHDITITTGSDVLAKRQAIITYIWGTEGFPSAKLPTSVATNVPSPLTGLENLERVDLLRIND